MPRRRAPSCMKGHIIMLKLSDLMNVDVYLPKPKAEGDPASLAHSDLKVLGKVRQALFYPEGTRVAGLLLRRPDVAGMIKRDDAFLALDSFVVGDAGLVVSREEGAIDEEAIARLGLDWERSIIWYGMDVRTSDKKDLGWVSDIEFSPKTGRVKAFYVDDGSMAKSLVGSVLIEPEMYIGYEDGHMIVDPGAAGLALSGGLAAKAGEGYAKAKMEGKKVADAAEDATMRGARGVGKAIGKAKRSIKKSGGTKGATKAVRKKLDGTRGMFSSFMDEYKKASK